MVGRGSLRLLYRSNSHAPVLEELLHFIHGLSGDGAVDDAMIVPDADGHHRPLGVESLPSGSFDGSAGLPSSNLLPAVFLFACRRQPE